MKPIVRSIISTLTMVLVVILAAALLGAVLDILRCVVIAAIMAIGGTYLYRRLTQHYTPAPKQIIDQPPSQSAPVEDPVQIDRQIDNRKKRLGQ